MSKIIGKSNMYNVLNKFLVFIQLYIHMSSSLDGSDNDNKTNFHRVELNSVRVRDSLGMVKRQERDG